MYRGAKRTLRYPIYLSLDIVWIVTVVYLIVADLVLRDVSLHWILMAILAAAALLHSARMTVTVPHLILKSVKVGAVVFVVAWLIEYLTGASFTPMVFATVVATGHYLHIGEAWTYERYRQEALLLRVKVYKQQHLQQINA
jgi:hypothetical protein